MGTEPATTTTAQKPFTNAATTFDAETETETRTETETETPEEVPISLDNVFEILKNQRRRLVLTYLSQRREPVSLSDLAEFVASEENGKPISQLSSQERKRVYVGLYQCHLTKMDDMGFIKFNKDRGIIDLGPAAEHAEKYLQADGPSRYTWPMYYLGLVGVGWFMLLGSLATGLLAPTVAGGVFLTLLTACALAHTYLSWNEPDGPTFDTPTADDA